MQYSDASLPPEMLQERRDGPHQIDAGYHVCHDRLSWQTHNNTTDSSNGQQGLDVDTQNMQGHESTRKHSCPGAKPTQRQYNFLQTSFLHE